MRLLCLILLLFSAKCFGQYPFEKYPARKIVSVPFKAFHFVHDSTNIAIARYRNYKIEALGNPLKNGNNILLYYKNNIIKETRGVFRLDNGVASDLSPLFIYHQKDRLVFIIKYYNMDGSGLAGSHVGKVYLVDRGRNNFSATSFGDFWDKPDRQYALKSDENYAIIGKSYVVYKDHSYWVFDLYNFDDGKLINVSNKYGYPIAVPYLYKETFKSTNKISRKELHKLSLKLPEFYTSN
jgi:hypothetical protein